ncbi:hypothetical protein DRP07_00130 [Archaeoglobales archaeon]|nr:MAG: hypothetical protein DRP07_00130 [Archaeoglobales archaeon]
MDDKIVIMMEELDLKIARSAEALVLLRKVLKMLEEMIEPEIEPELKPELKPAKPAKKRKRKSGIKEIKEIREIGEIEIKEIKPEISREGKEVRVEVSDYVYTVDKENDRIRVHYKPANSKWTYSYKMIKSIFDSLPERFTVRDLIEEAGKHGLEVKYQQALGLIRVFAHVDFDASIERVKNKIVVVKHSYGELRKQNIDKLKLESEVIGTPWEIEQ